MTLKKLCAGLMAGAACTVMFPASAQELNDAVETVTVVGLRAIMNNSVARQRASDVVESVVTRDAIGQFPDQNVAETTRRLPGVNVLDDQGEGRFIAVRGLAPDLNASSVNGVRLPAPEADIRAVALDVVPSELVESIEVIKTLTPDMDADTIGATIKINTTKGFDRKDPFFSAKAEGSYNNLNGKWSPKLGFDFAYPVSDKLGIAGGISYNRRQTSTDNMEMSGWGTSDTGIVYASDVEYRDYDVVRMRIGSSLSVDFKPFEGTTLYARVLYSIFNDTEQRRRLVFKIKGDPTDGDDDTATFTATSKNTITVRHDLKDRYESQIIQSYQLGGETVAGPWLIEYQGAFSRSSEHEWQTQDPTRFEKKFKSGLSVAFDYSNLETTTYQILTGETDFLDASEYEFSELDNKNGLAVDKEWATKVDVTRTFDVAGGEFMLKAGGKMRLRNKTYGAVVDIYDGYDGDYTLADVLGTASYDLVDVGLSADRSLVRRFNKANLANFEYDAATSEWESNSGTYDVDENIYAGYVMGRYSAGPLMVAGGVRVEHTYDYLNGNLVELVAEDGTHNGATMTEDTVFITPLSYKNTYTDVLPSISVRYDLSDAVMLRGGVFKSVVRPKIGDMAPRFLVEESDDGEREGEFGNPGLDPYRAWNFDVSAEWYFDQGGVVQAGLFYKRINDFIYTGNFKNGTFDGVEYNEAAIPLNGDTATAKGIEFNYQQALTMLPGPFDGLLVGFNYTYTDTSGDIGDRMIPLPDASRHTFNAMLGYEKDRWSVRATAAYRSGYLEEVGDTAMQDRYAKKHLQVDLTIKYKLTDSLRIYGEFVNLNNEPYLAYQSGPGRDRLLQYETYSWTGKFGIKATF